MRTFRPISLFALLASWITSMPARAAIYTLDDAGAKLTVTDKASGWIRKNPDSNGGNTVSSVTGIAQSNARTLTANFLISGSTYVLTLEVATSPSELRVTLGGSASTSLNGIVWPWPFFANDATGSAAVPYDSGYVVPTNATTFTIPGTSSP